jgi:hypothetical protein
MIRASYTAQQLAKELEAGTWILLESKLRQQYQESANKLIDEAVAATMEHIKIYIESVHKPHNGEVIFNLYINGVKQEEK